MKRLLAPVLLVTALAATQPACYGSYGAFHAVHGWNGKVTGNKIANSVIHFFLIPIYGVVIAGDILIFNNIEFVTGSNIFK